MADTLRAFEALIVHGSQQGKLDAEGASFINGGKKSMFSARLALVVALGLATTAMASEYRSGEVIVKFKDHALRSRKASLDLYNAAGVKNVRRHSTLVRGLEHLFLEENVKVQDAVAALLKSDEVEFAQPNYIVRAFPVMNANVERDPTLGVPCILPGIPWPPGCEDSGGGSVPPRPTTRPAVQPAPAELPEPIADPSLAQAYGLRKVQATEAWKEWAGSKDFIVGDIDTGIDYNHEDLAFNLWRNANPGPKKDVVGYDFIHDDGLPFDDNQHGTHTAGTIGAVGGNGKGVSGVSQRVTIMALKFLSGKGEGDTMGAIKAIDYGVAHGARILNNSWGGPSDENNAALGAAIQRAGQKGVLFVAAAGNGDMFGRPQNDDVTKVYPASFTYDNMFTIAATDSNDVIAKFSNYGKKTVHVGAPGVQVYSTVPGNKYAKFDGTSMACPHAVGAAALLWSKNPDWTYAKVKQVLMSTVDPIPSLNGKTVTGGRINILKALHSTE